MFKHSMLAITVLFATSLQAQTVYKCVDASGTIVFSATPCGPTATQIDTSAANRHQDVADAQVDLNMDADCRRRQEQASQPYNIQINAVQREIDDERRDMRRSANNLAGATRDQAISQRITALEGRKTTLLDEQNNAINAAVQACNADADAEMKRRMDRDAARAKAVPPKPKIDGD